MKRHLNAKCRWLAQVWIERCGLEWQARLIFSRFPATLQNPFVSGFKPLPTFPYLSSGRSRQKIINPTFDLEEIRSCLSAIALSHHGVTFTLRDESTDKKLLQTQSFGLPEKTFAAVHGNDWIDKLVPVHNERMPCEKIKRKISFSGKKPNDSIAFELFIALSFQLKRFVD